MDLGLKIPDLLRVCIGCTFGAVDVASVREDKWVGWAEGGDVLG